MPFETQSSFFSSFEQFSRWLDAKGMFHMDLSLARMQKALTSLSCGRLPVIQVLGTNGKGSTSAFIASLAKAHGLHCGLFISPHFLDIRERITVNSHILPAQTWLDAINELSRRIDLEDLTYFEVLTLLACCLFKSANVDLAILEAGLGGKNDATSALPALAHCFAPIAMDHCGIIGPTLRHIAQDKAAAIKPGSHVFSAPQYPLAEEIITSASRAKNASFTLASPLPPNALHACRLQGPNQAVNAALGLSVWQWLCTQFACPTSREQIRNGLLQAFLPGRLQQVTMANGQDTLIMDGAHNPHAIQALVKSNPPRPDIIFYAAMADKDWRNSMDMLASAWPHASFYLPALDNPRAARPQDLASWMAGKASSTHVFNGPGAMATALQQAGGTILVCGSLYLLAEIYKLFPQYLKNFSISNMEGNPDGQY